jgi:hypothetical protein
VFLSGNTSIQSSATPIVTTEISLLLLYFKNSMIHTDLQIKTVKELMSQNSAKYINRLSVKPNSLAVNLPDDRAEGNSLKRRHIVDLPEGFDV